MRQGPHSKRLRGRGTGRKNVNVRSQNFESNGPDVKVRGNAQQVVEKYLQLARDASSAGDRITAESYLQHAEHYYRLMSANTGQDGRNGAGNGAAALNGPNGVEPDGGSQPDMPGVGPQPDIEEPIAASAVADDQEQPSA